MSTDFGKWRSPVAHSAGGRAVAGSNPVFPTTSTGRSTGLGASYWSDLYRIRERRKITIEEIHADTKIPLGILREFEQNGLTSHTQLNAIYRRMLVVAYARAVGVDTELARRAMSSTLSGAYDGALARTYLSWSPKIESEEASGIDSQPALRGVPTRASRHGRVQPRKSSLLDAGLVTAIVMVAIVAVALLWLAFLGPNV